MLGKAWRNQRRQARYKLKQSTASIVDYLVNRRSSLNEEKRIVDDVNGNEQPKEITKELYKH